MLERIVVRLVAVSMLMAVIMNITGCAGLSGQTAPTDLEARRSHIVFVETVRDPSRSGTLQELTLADLIVEGTVTRQETRVIQYHATEAELAEREARGDATGIPFTDFEVTIDKVLKGRAPSTTVTVTQFGGTYKDLTIIDPEDPLFQLGDRVILFLRDISGDPIQAPGQIKYMVVAPAGRFRIEKDNTLSIHLPDSRNPVADAYRGKDKSELEKNILDLVGKLSPESAKEEVLQNTLTGSDLVVEGTIQDIREVRLIPDEGKSEEWIDQMLVEGKMPGLVVTDYTIMVDKVLLDKFANQPRFFPDRKPIESGQTIIVTRLGGTYKGVTKIEEPSSPFEIGSREIMFLRDLSLMSNFISYGDPGDGLVRYSPTDSRLGRLLIGPNNKLIAFTTKGLGGIYGGQDVEQLEQDIAEFLKTHPFNQNIPAPPQP